MEMDKMRRWIIEEEDTLTLDAAVPIAHLASSALVRQEAAALWEGAALEIRRAGRKEDTLSANSLRTVSCSRRAAAACDSQGSCDGQDTCNSQDICDSQDVCDDPSVRIPQKMSCIMEGGTDCAAIREEDPEASVFGGLRPGQTACQTACPLGIDIPHILGLIRAGDLLKASRTWMRYDPMPWVTSRVCRGFCAEGCARKKEGDPVLAQLAGELLGEHIIGHSQVFFAAPSGDSKKKVAVIGGGPLGLSAAFYLRRMGSHVTIYVRSDRETGDAEPYGLSDNVLAELGRYVDALKGMGVHIKTGAGVGAEGMADGKTAGKIVGKTEAEEILAGGAFDQVVEDGELVEDKELVKDGEPKESGAERFLRAVRAGCELAGKINLEFGLKSYVEPGAPFTSFSPEGTKLSGQAVMEKGTDLEKLQALAGRCFDHACYGVQGSLLAAVLVALEAELCTTGQRKLRAQDFYTALRPEEGLKEGEEIRWITVPKCTDYRSGCLTIREAKDDLTPAALVYAYAVKNEKILDARLVLGGAAPVPVRQFDAEKLLRGKQMTKSLAQEAADLIGRNAAPLAGRGKLDDIHALIQASFQR